MNVNDAWKAILEKYNIVDKVKQNGLFYITSKEINEFKEARLMTNFNSSSAIPEVLRNKKLNILPTSRGSYVIGDFNIYEKVMNLKEHASKMVFVELPNFESINVDEITSEANAINILILSRVLDDFLETDENFATFNGRMGTKEFDFEIDAINGKKRKIDVRNAQCEIDGGFENEDSIIILEAKNVLYEDFNVKQLYFPYRLWRSKVNKPIRLVFSIYSNKIFRLFEYEFTELRNYSSITLVRHKNYSLEDTRINLLDLIKLRKTIMIKTNDAKDSTNIPFIQADNFDRIISLLENIYNNPMTVEEIAILMQFDKRQSDYYFNAGKYLGLFEKKDLQGIGMAVYLTKLGEDVFNLPYKQRQLKLVALMLEHQIFMDLFDFVKSNGRQPGKSMIIDKMKEYDVCGEPSMERRSLSVRSWLKWIFNLTEIMIEIEPVRLNL